MAKTLIAYFSHAGQNYSHGSIRDLPVGNTEVVAKKIHALIDSDLFYTDSQNLNNAMYLSNHSSTGSGMP